MNDNINLESMSEKDLCKYADDYFGLVLSPKDYSKKELIQIITDAKSQTNNVTLQAVEDEDTGGPKPGFVRLIIARSGDKKQYPVFFGHQGVGYEAKRGKEIDIPAHTLSALADAVEDAMIYDEDAEKGDGYGTTVKQRVQSYPFSIIEWGANTEKAQNDYRISRKQLSY